MIIWRDTFLLPYRPVIFICCDWQYAVAWLIIHSVYATGNRLSILSRMAAISSQGPPAFALHTRQDAYLLDVSSDCRLIYFAGNNLRITPTQLLLPFGPSPSLHSSLASVLCFLSSFIHILCTAILTILYALWNYNAQRNVECVSASVLCRNIRITIIHCQDTVMGL